MQGVFAHGDEVADEVEAAVASSIDWTLPINYVYATIIWIILITIILFAAKGFVMNNKKTFFWLLTIPILLSAVYLAGHTVNHNIHSETGGPIHWHADYQVWSCGERLDLIDPKFPSNKIGTPIFHEHNDDRIHVEGTVADVNDVTVSAFFKTIGGKLTANELHYPATTGFVDVKTGESCNGATAELKVYVNGVRIDNVETYMYYPHPGIPPGDCIIVEFGANLPEKTDRICDFWSVEGWNYDNYKEKRTEPNMGPTWISDEWEYVDGEGMVRT